MMRVLRLVLAAALVLVARSAAAQRVRGELVEEESGRPVAAAFVVLLDGAGHRSAAGLTGADGGFVLAAPAPGRYTVRAERVGYAATSSAPLELAAGSVVPLRLSAGTQPVVLAGLLAAAGPRGCQVRPDGGATAAVWEEARKALDAAAWTEEQELVRFAVLQRVRELDPDLHLTREVSRSETRVGSRPFESPPAGQLATAGFMERRRDGVFVFHAPDAGVLLSDVFLDGHCFRVRDGNGGEEGLVGLGFQPVEGRSATGIAGTLWLDARTSELRHLEYRYPALRMRGPSDRVGGRVEFERLPTGAWIVRRWWIRTPLVAREASGRRPGERPAERVVGFREVGGEVTEVLPAPPRTAAMPRAETGFADMGRSGAAGPGA
jgi:hypothetical protein